ncbi:FecR domain-containing protein [Stenotrophomonas sp. MMGLT7]|uniref:FecR family protein n=1 Tax=Stenotrophomonas sp. MMGLT7 TaxID=2901227 RepID=UPI001E36DD34|nr:FecR domain-containing protein [Stenotrophomonas sp. MMGLT7]MCD7097024.1 FecR domain-containing protein [Stenotrophomonas sp. MMGLT7]
MNRPSFPSPRHARQALKWVLRQGSGEFSAHDQRRLAAWLEADPRHRAAYAQQQAFWRTVDQAGPEVLAALPELGAAGPAATGSMTTRPARRRRWPLPALAMAAALVLLVTLAPHGWLAIRSDLRAGAQPQAFTLEDGSEVFLDADSAVALHFSQDDRGIALLRGRAWFKVAHESRPFHVSALGGNVRDIGTAFAVALDGDAVTTAVGEGRVEVAAVAGGERVQLVQGQQIRYREGSALLPPPRPVAVAEIAPWRQGEILLDAVPARQAIAEIARYRRAPVWFVAGSSATEAITATFHADTPDEAIHAVADQAGLKVHRLPGGALMLTPRRG